MFEGIFHLFLIIIGGGMLLVGFIAFGYGLYGMSISGFDKAVRNISLIIGVTLISIVTFFYFRSQNIDNQETIKFVGKYESSDSGRLKVELKIDGTFTADSSLFLKTTGKWQIIDFDEFYKIDILSEDDITLKSLDIIEGKDYCKLRTDNHFTNVEDQLELIKL